MNRGKILAALMESGRVSIIPTGFEEEGEGEVRREVEDEGEREGASE
jgi:hypothetical protein